jgi:3-hydroxyisobutyrate dehydrogenase-like beta-hydroxyacid dehydrogenase
MTIKRVGLIGVGLMGHGIGRNILAKGFELVVMAHRNRAPVDDLIAKGATERTSALALAREADMVILCVTGTPQIEQLVYGEQGLMGAVRDGFVVADCSTAEPDSTVRIAADVEAKGGHFVDTPLTRTPKDAEAGKLGVMTGGPDEVLARIRPVLDCFADTIVHAGGVGSAHRLKLINNFIAIRNARKDLRYYTNMTEQLPVTSFMAETAHQITVMADNLGYGERFVPRLIDVLMKVNGLRS